MPVNTFLVIKGLLRVFNENLMLTGTYSEFHKFYLAYKVLVLVIQHLYEIGPWLQTTAAGLPG